MRAVILIASLVALAWCPAALAHGGGVPGFTSTVTSVPPPGVTVVVKDGDDRLRLENRSGSEVIIRGYDGEPYLRFAGDGVFRNANSPATYLNDDRYGQAAVPASADPKASPRWEKVADGDAYEWHDHRIHWMSPESPPQVRTTPDQPHHVFDWKVPGSIGGKPFVLAGSLDYAPPPSGGSIVPYVAAPVAALLLALGILAWRRSRPQGSGRAGA
jgi:hypothetical protein